MCDADWHDPQRHFLAMLLAGDVLPASAGSVEQTTHDTLLIVLNAYSNPVSFILPQTQYAWHCIFTTTDTEPSATALTELVIEPRSVHLFELKI